MKKNNNPVKRFAPKVHVKKGDMVMVISGSSKGQKGEVKEVIISNNRAIVDGLNMVKKHSKATQDNPGGINEMESPIHLSNLMLIDPKSGNPTKIGRKKVDGKSVRFSKKSGEIIK
jgi:large subunit ribosomal protein L24